MKLNRKSKKVNRKSKAAVGTSIGLSVMAATYYLWCHRHNIKGHIKEWKKERIKNLFYDTLEQKDVAWG
jgi:hypothetical protein